MRDHGPAIGGRVRGWAGVPGRLQTRLAGFQLDRRRRTVPGGRRFLRVYIGVLALSFLGFAALAAFADTHAVNRFDVSATLALQSVHLPVYGWVLTHASDLGYFPLSPLTYVVVFVGLAAARLRLAAVLAVVSALLAGVAGGGIKLVIERARPSSTLVHVVAPLNDYSFPSGHVLHYTTLFGYAFFVVIVSWRRSWPRDLVLVLLALPIALVGASRVYLGEHWPTDVIGAYLLGGLWLAGAIELHLWLKQRLGANQQDAGVALSAPASTTTR